MNIEQFHYYLLPNIDMLDLLCRAAFERGIPQKTLVRVFHQDKAT